MELPFAEPYKIKVVEPLRRSSREEREKWIKEARYNLFNLRSEQVFIDLLTDSGTGAMSHHQWSEMMLGDESYAGSASYFKLKKVINELLGMPYFVPTHQGRAAENVLFSATIKEGDLVPGNSHFDTTKGHIEFRRATAVDCTIDEASETLLYHPLRETSTSTSWRTCLETTPGKKFPCVSLLLPVTPPEDSLFLCKTSGR